MSTHSYPYPRPSLTVDCVVFGFDLQDSTRPLKVLLIRRNGEPFKGHWALPGGFVEVSDEESQGESLEDAAKRELEEESGLALTHLEQLYTFGEPGRDPRGRVVSVAYFGLVRANDYSPVAASDADCAEWVSVNTVKLMMDLAFDHMEILETAVTRLQGKIRYEPIGFSLLPETFTLAEFRSLYEGILGRKIDPSNFQKRILAMGILEDTGSSQSGVSGRRSGKLFRFDKESYDRATQNGFIFEV